MSRTHGVDVEIDGLSDLLRALNRFPKEANDALRFQSRSIADRVMVPAYRREAAKVPVWGEGLAADIRSTRDRVPAVLIGSTKVRYYDRTSSGKIKKRAVTTKTGKIHNKRAGASSIMVRYPTHSGDKGESHAPFTQTGWLDKAKTYKPLALKMWAESVNAVVRKWNRGVI